MVMSKKKAILLNATRLFSEKGYKETSMAELAKVTGSASGTIFYHFKSKRELFLSILQNVRDKIVYDFKKYLVVSEFENGLEMIQGAIGFYLDRSASMEDQFRLLHRHYAHTRTCHCKSGVQRASGGYLRMFCRHVRTSDCTGPKGRLHRQHTRQKNRSNHFCDGRRLGTI